MEAEANRWSTHTAVGFEASDEAVEGQQCCGWRAATLPSRKTTVGASPECRLGEGRLFREPWRGPVSESGGASLF
jgi:hypothetical protein